MSVVIALYARSSTTLPSVLVQLDRSVIHKLGAPLLRQDARPRATAHPALVTPVSAQRPVPRTTNVAAENPASRAVAVSSARPITSARQDNFVALEAALLDAKPTRIALQNKLASTDNVPILVRSVHAVVVRNVASPTTGPSVCVRTALVETRPSVAPRTNAKKTVTATWTNGVKTIVASYPVWNLVLAESTPIAGPSHTKLNVSARPVTLAMLKLNVNKTSTNV